MVEVPLFPLKLVLFNRSLFELEIFEPRYLKMVSLALANESGIGIVYLASGSEVYKNSDDAIELAKIGTLSSIKHTEVVDESRIRIVVEGGAKFRVLSTWTEDDRLNMGLVDILRDDAKLPLRTKDEELAQMFDQLNEFRNAEGHPKMTLEKNNASALSFRLAEMLPMAMEFRQTLLELDDPYRRLDRIQRWVQNEKRRD
ncbi:MAG: LON peptidase substrate-binding domain-containing protein [Gammaproteobacteria bacterium]|nr:LON peptidase substrate-binding domain-containing protein [Gammaproteobacteria bacterium]